MFSGIIEEKGMIVGKKISGQVATISIRGEKIFEDLSPGDSISVDGVCLTVEKIHFPVFSVTVPVKQ
jgi:Riboflavin synthase alpha chain